jgi:hypothetical protein
MPEVNAAMGALTIPIWAVGAIAAVFLVLIMLAIAQAGTAAVMNTLFRATGVIAVVAVGGLYIQNMERQERVAERRALDDRSAALLAHAVAPGSGLPCLNEWAGEAVQTACEKAVFASPEAVAAAVSYITAELDLLIDGTIYATRRDPAYGPELARLRTALELDRFGIVAHVLAARGCVAEKCDLLTLFGDTRHLLANLRDRTFDDRVSKSTSTWNAPSRQAADATVAAAPATARPMIPRFDFPSSESIPPVNIMVPEPGPRNGTAPQSAAAPGDGAAKPAAAPVPPRRPSPARAARPRPAAPPPVDPVAVQETPTDGAGRPRTQ